MNTEHDGVRDLLAAWAFGVLPPAEERAVPPHLAECDSCAAEAARLRETVRLLDGRPPNGSAPDGPAFDAVRSVALRARPNVPRVAAYAAPYAVAVAGLKALLTEAEGRWTTPVVNDWDVHATVAHLLAADEHLAELLGLAARVPASRLEEGTCPDDAWNRRTADVIAHEHGRTPGETVSVWAGQAADLLATAEARDHERAARAVTVTGLRLPVADQFLVRAFETWIHTDDIGRALGLAVPPPPEEHLGRLVRLAVRILGAALGPTAPPVLFAVDGADQWVLGSADDPVRAELSLAAVDFCLLVGGRYTPAEVPRAEAGDEAAVRNVLERAASLSWL